MAGGATPTSSATTTGSPIAPRGPPGCSGPVATRIRSWRSCSTGCVSSIRARPPAGGWSPTRWRMSRRRRSSPRRWRACPCRPSPSPHRPRWSLRRPRPCRSPLRRRWSRWWRLGVVVWRSGCWRSLLSRRVIRRICWTWTLDLEADLGIDTVKQAEVFANIREAYGIERDDSLKLRDYPTLNHVVAFVNERSDAPGPSGAGARARVASRACAGGGAGGGGCGWWCRGAGVGDRC